MVARAWVAAGATAVAVAAVVGSCLYIFLSGDAVGASNIVSGVLAPVALASGLLIFAWRRLISPAPTVSSDGQLAAAAERLCREVHASWRNEAAARGITTPATVAVAWEWADNMCNVVSPRDLQKAAAQGSGPSALSQRTHSRKRELLTAGVVHELHDLYAQLQYGKLIILGEKGAGKTGALVLLLLAAVDHRASVEPSRRSDVPVPVLLPVTSWDPDREPLAKWATRNIYRDNEYLRASAYGPKAVEQLLASGRIALFLDGLDEMPESMRDRALVELSRQPTTRIVLTSRFEQFNAATKDHHATHAAVIEMLPVSPTVAGEYLEVDQVGSKRELWRRFAKFLRSHPQSPVAMSLSTPLALGLAREACAESMSPFELADEARFPDQESILRSLIGSVVPAAYRGPEEQRNAETVLRWLAQQMNARNARDLAWWQLRNWLNPALPPAVGAVLFGCAGGVTQALVGGWRDGLLFGASWALAACVTATVIVVAGTQRNVQVRGSAARVFVAGPLGGVFALGLALIASDSTSRISGIGRSVGIGAALGFLNGIAIGLVALHDGPLRGRVRVPERRDVIGGVAAGVASAAIGALFGDWKIAAVAGVLGSVGFTVTAAWTRPSDEPRAEVSPQVSYATDLVGGLMFFVLSAFFVGLAFGLSVGLTHNWKLGIECGIAAGVGTGAAGAITVSQAAVLLVVRANLRLRQIAPWRLMPFLAEARNRQVLRQVGTLYQFRHGELQDYLAEVRADGVRRNEHESARALAAPDFDVT